MKNKIRYGITLCLSLLLLVATVVTVATSIQVTSSKITLKAIEENKVSISIQPEETIGVTAFQLFLKVEPTSITSSNYIDNILFHWNDNWNTDSNIVLKSSEYNHKENIFSIYVVSNMELTQDDGTIPIGILEVMMKDTTKASIKVVPMKDKSYVISPENQSSSLQILIDTATSGVELKMGKETNENEVTNHIAENQVVNQVTNIVLGNQVINEVIPQVNEIKNEQTNVISNTQTNITQLPETNRIANQQHETPNSNQVTNSVANSIQDNQANTILPQTGETITIFLLGILFTGIAITGIVSSIYHLRKK